MELCTGSCSHRLFLMFHCHPIRGRTNQHSFKDPVDSSSVPSSVVGGCVPKEYFFTACDLFCPYSRVRLEKMGRNRCFLAITSSLSSVQIPLSMCSGGELTGIPTPQCSYPINQLMVENFMTPAPLMDPDLSKPMQPRDKRGLPTRAQAPQSPRRETNDHRKTTWVSCCPQPTGDVPTKMHVVWGCIGGHHGWTPEILWIQTPYLSMASAGKFSWLVVSFSSTAVPAAAAVIAAVAASIAIVVVVAVVAACCCCCCLFVRQLCEVSKSSFWWS